MATQATPQQVPDFVQVAKTSDVRLAPYRTLDLWEIVRGPLSELYPGRSHRGVPP